MSAADITIDFSDIKSDEYTAVPAGKYSVVIEEVTLRTAEATEEKPNPFPYLNFRLKIDEGEFEGRNLFTIASFSEKALGRTKALLESLGVDVTGEVGLNVDQETDVVTEPDLQGEPAIATVRLEKDRVSGETRSRVAKLTGTAEAPEPVAVGGNTNTKAKVRARFS